MIATHDQRELDTMTCSNNLDHEDLEEHGSHHEQDNDKAEGHQSAEQRGTTIQKAEHHEDQT